MANSSYMQQKLPAPEENPLNGHAEDNGAPPRPSPSRSEATTVPQSHELPHGPTRASQCCKMLCMITKCMESAYEEGSAVDITLHAIICARVL